MRQDLCTRHRERHTARGSHLQRKDTTTLQLDNTSLPSVKHDGLREQADGGYQPSMRPYAPTSHLGPTNGTHFASNLEAANAHTRSPTSGRFVDPYQSSSTNTTPRNNNLNSPQSIDASAPLDLGATMASLPGSHNDDTYYADAIGGFEAVKTARNVPMPSYDSIQRQSTSGSYKALRPGKNPYVESRRPQSSANLMISPQGYRPTPTSSYSAVAPQSSMAQPHMPNGVGNDFHASPPNYMQSLPLPPPIGPSMPQTPISGPPATYTGDSLPLAPVEASSNVNGYGPSEMETHYIDPNGNGFSIPYYGVEGYSRSPRATAEDFTAWLFNEPYPHSSSPGGLRQGSMSFGTTAFMDDFDGVSRGHGGIANDTMNGNNGQYIPQQHPMALNSILDQAPLYAILSEGKRRDILELIETRFTDHTTGARRKDEILDGNRDADDHVLSLRSMQTYIKSYWYHFHPQMPILHKPTFSADTEQSLLLIAVIAIGASCLDKMHGPDTTQAGAELSNFLAWHLRGEIFKDVDFSPPAKLWIFQTLLLLEVYEKMYSTRKLHERAHIHHGTTLTLMRRGSSLIGRSALDSPPVGKEDKDDSLAGIDQSVSATSTPEQWWNHWITNEATRRVAFAAYIIDSIHATMFGHSATMVAHEMKLALPCDESLWSATSSADVARIEGQLQAQGVKSMTFFDGLKNTLKGKPVRTNPFGRTAIMAGLLSVTWHMNQRDVQIHHLGALKALGGKDVWRGPLTKAFDSWKHDFDQSVGKDKLPMPGRLDEENIFESRTVLHHLSHMAMHVDIVSCQIFAGAGRLLGRTTLPSDYEIAQKRIKTNWAPRPSARHATFYALKFLNQVLLPDAGTSSNGNPLAFTSYSARDDFLLNRPWVLYYAILVVWSYGYALDGPVESPPALLTIEDQVYDMKAFLTRVAAIQAPSDLEHMQERNTCLGLLYVLRENFNQCRWQLLHEAANLLTNCINKLKGSE